MRVRERETERGLSQQFEIKRKASETCMKLKAAREGEKDALGNPKAASKTRQQFAVLDGFEG